MSAVISRILKRWKLHCFISRWEYRHSLGIAIQVSKIISAAPAFSVNRKTAEALRLS